MSPAVARRVGAIPVALHDTPAVTLAGVTFIFGGGDGVNQHSEILRSPGGGGTKVVGHLPNPSSDQAAAAIGGTAYVVGGYTGTRWLDSIVAGGPA